MLCSKLGHFGPMFPEKKLKFKLTDAWTEGPPTTGDSSSSLAPSSLVNIMFFFC